MQTRMSVSQWERKFDDLLKEVFAPKATHKTQGVTDPHRRQVLRAEVDALVAWLYELTTTVPSHLACTPCYLN